MKIYEIDGIKFIDINELPESEKIEIQSFMWGQTLPYVENHPGAIYYLDYLNFKEFKKGNPYYFD